MSICRLIAILCAYVECKHSEGGLKTHREALERRPFILKDAVPVSVRAELFTSYPLTMFKL